MIKKTVKPFLYACVVIASVWCLSILTKTISSNKYKGDCINYQDKQFFKEPIPVEWIAKFDTCLSSCWGGAFTRVPEDSKYPRFSGYVPDDGEKISDIYLEEGQTLKITGLWTDVSDSYASVFDNLCVPTIEIQKIEIFK
ncbi:MAG: hypothetical protein ABH819_03480 [Patescibacteria group bacterium]